ncbi:MAG TPA: glucoamylase family protein, partial [Melioribacteraceae bacterium]|nr:glucoamylase family protein [Melioribacteraceae bacterium]
MKKILLIFWFSCITVFASNYKLTEDEKNMLDSLQYKTFLYFINEINFENGLVKDRSTDYSPASIAATGFAIPVWAVGVENKWIDRETAIKLTVNLLKFLLNSEQSENDSATGYMGFYYHFLDMKTGKRMWKSELSSIDTGLLLAGIRFAVQYFDRDTSEEILLRKMADLVTNKVNWNFFCINKEGEHKNTIAMEWDPEKQLSNFGWKGYNEALIMYIIAAGSNYKNIEDGYNNWLSSYKVDEPYKGLRHILFP